MTDLSTTRKSAIPPGWTIKRADKVPFKRIELSVEHGRGMRYTAIVDSMARNPENILYMLAEDLLKMQEDSSKTEGGE